MAEKFTATEGTTQPIVLGKEPVPRPVIMRGEIRGTIHPSDTIDTDAARITFRMISECGLFVVTYHLAILRAINNHTRFEAGVLPWTIVTWEHIQ